MKNSSHRAVSQRFTAIAVVLAALSEDASTKARSIETTLPVIFEAKCNEPRHRNVLGQSTRFHSRQASECRQRSRRRTLPCHLSNNEQTSANGVGNQCCARYGCEQSLFSRPRFKGLSSFHCLQRRKSSIVSFVGDRSQPSIWHSASSSACRIFSGLYSASNFLIIA